MLPSGGVSSKKFPLTVARVSADALGMDVRGGEGRRNGPAGIGVFQKPAAVRLGGGGRVDADGFRRKPSEVVAFGRIGRDDAVVAASEQMHEFVFDQSTVDVGAIDERAERLQRTREAHLFLQPPCCGSLNVFAWPRMSAAAVRP